MSLIAANLSANYTGAWSAYEDDTYGQVFEVPSGTKKTLTSVDIYGYFLSAPAPPMVLAVFSVAGATEMPVSSALAVVSRSTTGLGTTLQWIGFDFSGKSVELTAGEHYAFVCYVTAITGVAPFKIGYDTTGIYSGGINFRDTSTPLPPGTANTTWTALAGDDLIFRIYGKEVSQSKKSGNRIMTFARNWGW